MNHSGSTKSCAVRLPPRSGEERTMEAALGPDTWSASTKFLPKDDDELNSALCAGRFQRVVFADLDSLLEMLWKDEFEPAKWMDAGVHVELLSPPPGAKQSWHETVLEAHRSLSRWRAQQRKRQIVAAVLLSAVALAAMAVLFWLIPPAK